MKTILPISLLMLLGLFMLTPTVSGQLDNIDLWEEMTEPWESLFPIGGLFWVFLFGVATVGVYMKTQSAGAVVIVQLIFGVLLSSLVPGVGAWLFRVMIAVATAVLLYMLFKGR